MRTCARARVCVCLSRAFGERAPARMTRDFASMCVCVRALAQLHKAAAYKQVFGAGCASACCAPSSLRIFCCWAHAHKRVRVCVQCANTKTTSRVCAQQPETEKEIKIGAHQCSSRPAEMLASMHPNTHTCYDICALGTPRSVPVRAAATRFD